LFLFLFEGPPTEFIDITIPKEEDPGENPDGNETANGDEEELPVWILIVLIILVIAIALVIAFPMLKRMWKVHHEDLEESVDDGLSWNEEVSETGNRTEM
jgi:flagellar basal body-associated protein FliL